MNNKIFFRISLAACSLTFCVVVLSAYACLSDAVAHNTVATLLLLSLLLLNDLTNESKNELMGHTT